MDPHQQHQQHPGMQDEQHASMPNNNYAFYQPEQEHPYAMSYNTQMPPYHQVIHTGPQTRPLHVTDLQQQQQQQGMQYPHMGLISQHQYQPPVYSSSPPHVSLALSTSPPSPSPEMFDPLSPPISGSDTSADGIYHHSNSSGTGSPSSSRGASLVHRHIRYNPTPSPTSSTGRRTRGRSHDSDDEDMLVGGFPENLAHSRKEATRRQRIEAEQRRRDELRDGYAKLKDVLPVSNQKSSKVSLLERATNHIVALEKANEELQTRINDLEKEMQRLRAINEKISLGSTETPSPGMFEGKPLSPAPEDKSITAPSHSLSAVHGQEPTSQQSSPSASEGGRSGF